TQSFQLLMPPASCPSKHRPSIPWNQVPGSGLPPNGEATNEDPHMKLIFTSLAGAAAVMATSALLSLPASAERVCRQECAAGVCKEQCGETTERERDRVIIEGRGERRE